MSRSASDGERGNEIWVITPYLRHMSFSLFMWTCWQTQLSLLMHRVMSREVGGAVTKMAHCVYCSGRPMSVPLLNIGVPSPADQLSQWKLPVDPTSKWALKSHTHTKRPARTGDVGTSYVLTCLRCLPEVWQRNCTVYIQQHQHQCRHLSFAYADWSVSTDLIFLWYLGLGCTRFHECLQLLMRKSSFPSGNFYTFRCAFRK